MDEPALPIAAELGFARVDLERYRRCGLPETIFCPGKTSAQVAAIAERLAQAGQVVLATRATAEQAYAVQQVLPDAEWHEHAGIIRRGRLPELQDVHVGICCAGTADLKVAEECRLVAETFGVRCRTFFDVGVAGLHRLLAVVEPIRACTCLVVVAGMEGALPSVVGGLVAVPVIAVPTSVGYGAQFAGLAPLLTMINSCAANVTVVNIDNGFGAAVSATLICRLVAATHAPIEGGG